MKGIEAAVFCFLLFAYSCREVKSLGSGVGKKNYIIFKIAQLFFVHKKAFFIKQKHLLRVKFKEKNIFQHLQQRIVTNFLQVLKSGIVLHIQLLELT